MDENNSMYVLRERKHKRFNAACCDFVRNHDIEKIAKTMNMDGQALRNMLNPEQPRILNPVMLAMVSYITQDYSIVNTLHSDDGVVMFPVPKSEEDSNLIERVLKHSALSGELSSDALAMCSAERFSRYKQRKTIAKAQLALGNLVLLINQLEDRTSGLQPLMQFGTDLLASGAAIPGLA